MAAERKEINIHAHTLENKLEIDSSRSLLPIILTGDRCLIEPIVTEDDKYLSVETKLLKSVNAKEQFTKGRVMSIGGGEYGATVPDSLKVNLIVNYWHTQAIDYVVEGKKYHLIRASDIFMLL